jgi:hypothetical protein
VQDPRANLNRNVDPAVAPEVMSQISRLLAGRVVQIERRAEIRSASPGPQCTAVKPMPLFLIHTPVS